MHITYWVQSAATGLSAEEISNGVPVGEVKVIEFATPEASQNVPDMVKYMGWNYRVIAIEAEQPGGTEQPEGTESTEGNKKPDTEINETIGASDYSVTYSNNTKVGIATVIVTFKGNYSGTLTKTFEIKPKGTKLSKITAKKKSFFGCKTLCLASEILLSVCNYSVPS